MTKHIRIPATPDDFIHYLRKSEISGDWSGFERYLKNTARAVPRMKEERMESYVARQRRKLDELQGRILQKDSELKLFRDKVAGQEHQIQQLQMEKEHLAGEVRDRKMDIVMYRAKYLTVLDLHCAQNRLDVKDLHPIMAVREHFGDTKGLVAELSSPSRFR